MDSILTSVKKLLGLPADYEAFDPDIIMYMESDRSADRLSAADTYPGRTVQWRNAD